MAWFLISLLPFSFLLGYFQMKWDAYKKKMIEHKIQSAEISNLYRLALDYRYKRHPLIASSEKERAYFNKLKVHYKNTTRAVVLIPLNYGEDPPAHAIRKNNYIRKYCSDNHEEIIHGVEEYSKEFRRANELGLLKWLDTPYDTEASKAYLFEFVDFLIKHPRAEHGNYQKGHAERVGDEINF